MIISSDEETDLKRKVPPDEDEKDTAHKLVFFRTISLIVWVLVLEGITFGNRWLYSADVWYNQLDEQVGGIVDFLFNSKEFDLWNLILLRR